MENIQNKIYIGFITHNDNTAKYLPYFLPSLKAQSHKDFKILAVDNSAERENENSKYLKANFPEIDLKWTGENLGFAKAFNLMINCAMDEGAEYFLALNPDMIFEPEMLEKLVAAMKKSENIGAVQAKTLKWDFANNKKTNIVDSYGVICDRKFRFRDDGQGQIDNPDGAIDKEIFGFTGAAVLLNLKALRDAAFDNGAYQEYFDELMFMYKEDCDLSMRLRLAGWKIMLAGQAVAYHNRSNSRFGDSLWRVIKNRQGKKRLLKIWSNWGQWLIVFKYAGLPFSFKTKFSIWWYELEIFIFMVLFEQYLLKDFLGLWRARKLIAAKKQQLKVRINMKELEALMK